MSTTAAEEAAARRAPRKHALARHLLSECIAKTHLPPLTPDTEPGRWASTLRTGQARAAAREAIEHARAGDEARCMSALVLAEAVGGYEREGRPAQASQEAAGRASKRLRKARAAAVRAAASRLEAEAAVLRAALKDCQGALQREVRVAGCKGDGLYLSAAGELWRQGAGVPKPTAVTAEVALGRWTLEEIILGLVVVLESAAESEEVRAAVDERRVSVLRAIVTLLGAGV